MVAKDIYDKIKDFYSIVSEDFQEFLISYVVKNWPEFHPTAEKEVAEKDLEDKIVQTIRKELSLLNK